MIERRDVEAFDGRVPYVGISLHFYTEPMVDAPKGSSTVSFGARDRRDVRKGRRGFPIRRVDATDANVQNRLSDAGSQRLAS